MEKEKNKRKTEKTIEAKTTRWRERRKRTAEEY